MKKASKMAAIFLMVIIVLGVALFAGCEGGGEKYEKGILTETSFESEYLDLRFIVPEGYIMSTQEDLDALIDFGGEIIYKDVNKIALDYAKANTVYEMMVAATSGAPNISLCVEKPLLGNITADQYLDALSTTLSSLSELQYSINSDRTSVDLAGQTYTMISATATYGNVRLTQNYMARKVGNRILGIVVTYTDDTKDEADMMLSLFTKY